MNQPAQQTVAIAMSGGVDSSVAAMLLKDEGYRVFGITLKLWISDSKGDEISEGATALNDAKRVAEYLKIQHYTLDLQSAFREEVVDYFTNAYTRGITPNPCPRCNDMIKFGILLDETKKLGADFLATGHYAQVSEKAGYFAIRKGVDPVKDQSYFIYRLDQERLSHLMFPLGKYKKVEIRDLAAKGDLPVKNKPESQDICFIENDNYRDFLTRNTSFDFQPGPIVTENGRTIGKHKGLAFYTIGQRKGLGVAAGKPVYVTRLDMDNNQLIVGESESRQKTEAVVGDVTFVSGKVPTEPMEINVKIRSTAKEVPATLIPISIDQVKINSHNPLLDVAPGQSAVFYVEDQVLGGGIIQRG